MMDLFEVASGSVVGRDHVHIGKNNQDAHCVVRDTGGVIAVVCDGSSSGKFSEFGARLGARLIATSLHDSLRAGRKAPDALERARLDVLAQIRLLANVMGFSLSQTISDYFLFTVVVAILEPLETTIAAIGDGAYAVNGELVTLGPFPENAPPYLAYAITGSPLTHVEPGSIRFQPHSVVPTADIQSLIIGSDGVGDLDTCRERNLPGRQECVGPLSQFWENDRFFKNPFILGRRLNLINPPRPTIRVRDGVIERSEGLLLDDTTLVAVRRKAVITTEEHRDGSLR